MTKDESVTRRMMPKEGAELPRRNTHQQAITMNDPSPSVSERHLASLYVIHEEIQAAKSVDDICGIVVEQLNGAMQFPEITVPVIALDGVSQPPEDKYPRLSHGLHAEIRAEGELFGELCVYYTENRAFTLPEEQRLIDHTAEIIGRWIENAKAGTKLRESEHKYRMLVENIPQRIFIKDENLTYISFNDHFARDLGIAADDLVGKSDFDLLPTDLAEKHHAADLEVLSTGRAIEIEKRYSRNRRSVWERTIKTPVIDETGVTRGVLGIYWDITDRKQAENELAKTLSVERRQAAQIASELDLASKIQSVLMESSTIAMDGLEMTASWVPAHEMSGDFYSLQPLDDHRLGMWVGDVSAKGVPAGLLMVLINAYLHAEMLGAFAPGNVLSQLGLDVYELLSEAEQFSTLFLGVLDTTNGLLKYSDAGHGQALVFRSSTAEIEELCATVPPLGVEERLLAAQIEIRLQPADVLLIYSDGISEAASTSGEFFGEQRLLAVVEKNGHKSTVDLRDAILSAVAEFSQGATLMDDQTLLVIKRMET